jgi:phosphorylcholine metabolism protein LicD/2-polyprenyl-3-methyl-5-hydroxy-6-metoxy-1,4-benzoquinol methylase
MAFLNMEFSQQIPANEKIMDVDIDIKKYISQSHSNDYDNIIREDDRWEVFYHLSSMRTSLFNWYDFKEGAELLEIGGGFGALTGLFCQKCTNVTTVESNIFRAEAIQQRYADLENLNIFVGQIENIIFKEKFDYIILVGMLEEVSYQGIKKLSQYLQRLSNFLKPEGKLLIAVENRFGIRYFCGAVESTTGRPFAGLNPSPEGKNRSGFSKKEMIDLLKESGLRNHKFYYPLPDYKLPQLIYSEQFLPQSELRERLIPYYTNPRTLVAKENEIYDDLVDNNVFEFFSNSFLIECALDSQFSTAIFAAVTTDRGKENGFATIIHQDETVVKRPLFQEGQKNARKIYENIKELKDCGIGVVPHDWEQNSLIMPYIQAPTLSDYLSTIISSDKEQFLMLIDKLYDCILHSSEHVEAHMNVLNKDNTHALDFGVILKNAYLDMIPFNCFYMEGNLLFFDQEFIEAFYPAKYVLFRALKYIYLSNPSIEHIVPLYLLKKKYGLMDFWSLFEREESKFVSDNRKYEIYKNFYRWSNVDKKQILKNQKLLLAGEYEGDPEVIDKLHEIHKVQLDLLNVFIEVCEKHKLKYFAVHGTLLGAVRHKGFIPWDDDVDIAMPRKDYEKLKKLARNVFPEPYVFQTNENDREVFNGSLSRLRNSRTTGIEYKDFNQSGNLGIWIDIIALDFMYKDPILRSKQLEKIQFYQKLLLTKTYGVDLSEYEEFPWKQRVRYYILSKLFIRKWLLTQFNKACSSCEEDVADYIGTFTRYTRKDYIKLLDKKVFDSAVQLPFEKIKLFAPKGYQQYLSTIIGKKYLEYPSIEKRAPHHKGIFQTDIPYKRFTGTFRHTRKKDFVLFGSGQMFDHYMQNFGRKFRPLFIVDNDQTKWNTKKHGVVIKSPKEVLSFNKDEIRLVICSIHFREIGKQLEQMGIDEYYIYIQNKEWL